jgi:toxin ParE1/3/4
MKIVLRPAARRDILLQVGYYVDELAFDAAERFPVAVECVLNDIREHPAIGAPQLFRSTKLAGLRSWPVPGFEDIRV